MEDKMHTRGYISQDEKTYLYSDPIVKETILPYKGRNVLALQFSRLLTGAEKKFKSRNPKPVDITKLGINNENGIGVIKGRVESPKGNDEISYVVVSGYVLSTEGENENGRVVSKIEPVKEESERREISDLVESAGMKGNVNFW